MEEEEEEKKLMREVKWGLKLLGASAWSRLTVMEGVRCEKRASSEGLLKDKTGRRIFMDHFKEM
jgi:hypothetical protein